MDRDAGWPVRARFMHISLARVSAAAAPWCLEPVHTFTLNVPQLSAVTLLRLKLLFPGLEADSRGE